MSKPLKDLLVGLILGDASIRKVGIDKARLTFDQSGKKTDYFNYVYDFLKSENLVSAEAKLRPFTDSRYPGTNYSAWNLTTDSLESLRPLADAFLDAQGKKMIPTNISEYLTPRSLAYWIMDDGQHVARGGVTLCTDSFKHEEIIVLQDALKSNFDLKTTIHYKKVALKYYERIYISKNSAFDSLKPSIAEHMDNSMLYKLNMGPKPSELSNPNISDIPTIVETPNNTPANILAPNYLSDEVISQIVEENASELPTLSIVDEILQEIANLQIEDANFK